MGIHFKATIEHLTYFHPNLQSLNTSRYGLTAEFRLKDNPFNLFHRSSL
jgi:hypothetical protein